MNIDDVPLSLCEARPEEMCYKPCRIHNALACDGDEDEEDLCGLPDEECGDDDVFYAVDGPQTDEEEHEEEREQEAEQDMQEAEQYYQVADHFYGGLPRQQEDDQVPDRHEPAMDMMDRFEAIHNVVHRWFVANYSPDN